jgi:hypothetical protein
MQKVNRFKYTVKLTEAVTIKVKPSVNLGHLYTANLDGHEMAKPADATYRFTVTRPVGKTHFFIIVLGFEGAEDGAQYVLEINGSGNNNAGPFNLTVAKDDPMHDVTLLFKVT